MGPIVSLTTRYNFVLINAICSPKLEIFAWEHGKFLQRNEPGPGRIVPITAILSQACRLTIDHKEQIRDSDSESEDDDSDVEAETSSGPTRKLWFTAGLTRVWPCLNQIDRVLTDFLSIGRRCVVIWSRAVLVIHDGLAIWSPMYQYRNSFLQPE
jgi:hypothetical protein